MLTADSGWRYERAVCCDRTLFSGSKTTRPENLSNMMAVSTTRQFVVCGV